MREHTLHMLSWRVSSPCLRLRCRRRVMCFSQEGSGSDSVRVSFALPYRCTFGQHLCLVGSISPLGAWDVRQGVAMSWSEGDVWTVDLELHTRAGSHVEYKYVVRNEDGTPTVWKPGSNLQLPLQSGGGGLPEALRVSDAWDESWRSIEVETRVPVSVPSQREGSDAGPAERAEDVELAAVAAARTRALADLDQAITQSLDLLSSAADPAAPEVLAADRVIAANARRALTFMKALQASDPKQNRWLAAPASSSEGALEDGAIGTTEPPQLS
ncbi:hypothetical protein WJX81_002600 [Elliptochloris bilobata]|uniref:CBM20 domain-containing protein n=1 Tax=Elliptochloris bilobata TaxID=381761 RepID=A0AAW1QMH5_9CHLO